MSHTEIYPVGIHADKARRNFEQRVVNKVPKSEYKPYTDRDLGDSTRVWGYREKGKGTWRQISEGDYFIFYPGNLTYKYTSEIIGREHNPELGSRLFETPDENFEYIVYLGSLHEISIDSEILHREYAGYNIGHPVKSQPFNDTAYEEILHRYESVEGYLEAHLEQSDVSLTEKSSQSGIRSKATVSSDPDEAAVDLRPPKKSYTVSRSIRNTKIANELKDVYNYKCQVCGEQRKINSSGYAEAHHIHPLGDDPPGPDVKSNLLVLCPNHHADFDFGMLQIDPETLEISHTYEDTVDGSKLIVNPDHNIETKHILYHNKNL